MKLHFEPDLDYQLAAIESVCALFKGQEIGRTEFTVTLPSDELAFAENSLGIGNRLKMLEEEIHANLKAIQLRNGLGPSPTLASMDFTVEMETGTGKTYVYLRTLFELYKRYGFTKFVIIVPSVAIKEGVYKSIRVMEEHFRGLYANTPFEYFLYDSKKPGQVRNFATSPNIQIMVVTVGAINKKDVNNLYKESEKTGGEKPIDLVRATRPILIVDEPQSVDGGLKGQGKKALEAMFPLCTLRYSATHVDKHHMLYRLDAVDAYEKKLVKQIEVAALEVDGGHNRPFVRLLNVQNTRGRILARVELDVLQGKRVVRKTVTVGDGDDLEQITRRALYADHRIGEIRVAKDNEFMELRIPGGEHLLRPGGAFGDIDQDEMKRQMIRRTIKEHLDKEKRLQPLGIKVLSLFFIDTVAHYRSRDADGNTVKGKYAQMFEEAYRQMIRLPDYQTLFRDVDDETLPERVHNGYFSIDRKGIWTDTAENNQTNRDNAERAYNLIMKDKERLLGFDTPLKFIFSHSALREGWDNPNVFQICVLRDMGTEMARRQSIGRGLRLCVNQNGERLRGFGINTLTVVATESYERFAETLQREIEADSGIRFGIVEKHQFAGLQRIDERGRSQPLGAERSEQLWNHLRKSGHIDARGNIQDGLRATLKTATLHLPETFNDLKPRIMAILKKLAGRLEIKNADERVPVKTRRAVLHSAEFQALWDRIKHKTTYRVGFDNQNLIETCARAIGNAPPLAKTRLQVRKADLAIGKSGVETRETTRAASVTLQEPEPELPDLLSVLQDNTQLTRRSIVQILISSGRLNDFLHNPQQFIEMVSETINRAKRLVLVDGIRYQKIGDDHFYAQELFEEKELEGYLKNMLMNVTKSVHEHIIHDSAGVEKPFAEDLERNEAVKVYAKLPGWFKIPTPLGTYNPDWAVLVDNEGEEKLFLVVETKGGLFFDDLREKENARIACGKAHFKALANGENPAKYVLATRVDDLMNSL